jgi:hypothetical protein
MFGSLVRWFGSKAMCEQSRGGAAIAPRFTPQLESLEGRAVPGGAGPPIHGEEIPQVCVRQETPSPYQPGYEVALTDGAGGNHGDRGHQVDLMGSAGGAGPVVWLMGSQSSGIEFGVGVDPMGSAGGSLPPFVR